MTSHGFRKYLQEMPNIQGFELQHGFEFVVNEPNLIQLSNMRHLKHLSLGQTNDITSDVVLRSDFKLQNLQSLDLYSVTADGIRDLLPRLSNLRFIALAMRRTWALHEIDIESDILLPLSKCANLSTASLEVERVGNISTLAFTALATGCQQLRQFELNVQMPTFVILLDLFFWS